MMTWIIDWLNTPTEGYWWPFAVTVGSMTGLIGSSIWLSRH